MKRYSLLFCMLICFFATAVKAQTGKPGDEPKVIVDNAKMKVVEYDSMPGQGVCGRGKHSHVAHLTVLLTEATVTITGPDGKTKVRKTPAGASFWSDATTHVAINSGGKRLRVLLVFNK